MKLNFGCPSLRFLKAGDFSCDLCFDSAGAGHTATLLQNGFVLVAGSASANDPSADLYNPSTGTWTLTGNLNTKRGLHTATLLNDDTVLIAGGMCYCGFWASIAELYNPSTGTFGRVARPS